MLGRSVFLNYLRHFRKENTTELNYTYSNIFQKYVDQRSNRQIVQTDQLIVLTKSLSTSRATNGQTDSYRDAIISHFVTVEIQARAYPRTIHFILHIFQLLDCQMRNKSTLLVAT